MSEKNQTKKSTLYLVATPIGNLSDLSSRAVKVLTEVDFIAAEDTRNTGQLLAYLGLSKPLVSYHEHNKHERGEQICERLLSGESCALVTDAGTPAISDPGEDLVSLCAARGITVTSIPGCCAGITALTLSALPTRRFTFEGFLSVHKSDRKAHLDSLKNETRTMIFHEAPHKLKATLSDLCETFGEDRRLSLCRELTKLNEEILRMTIAEAILYYENTPPRGEYVLVIEGRKEGECSDVPFWQDMSVPAHVEHYVSEGMTKKEAIKATAKDRGVSKNDIYQQVIDH